VAATSSLSPDEQVLRSHLDSGPFQSGLDRGRWRLISIDWPYVLVAISAAPDRGPAEYVLRFECSNYPQSAPTAQLWDVERQQPLAPQRWPGGRGRVPLAFNPGWKGGSCIYLPCDRLSFEGHEGWRTQHPSMIWSPSKSDLTLYLRIVHDLLNSPDYTGPISS
jgi:hypothetical protein